MKSKLLRVLFAFLLICNVFSLDFFQVFGFGTIDQIKQTLLTINIYDEDSRGYPPLFYAAGFNTREVVEYLIKEKNADYKYPRRYMYAFDFALCYSIQPDVIALFIDLNAPYSLQISNPTPLFTAVSFNQNTNILDYLFSLYPDVNAVNAEGMTLLMNACKYNYDINAIQYLLDKGADVNIRDYHKKTAYDYAIENEKLKNKMLIINKLASEQSAEKNYIYEFYNKIREFAQRKYPYDQSMQDYIYKEQIDGYNYMCSVTDEEIKNFAVRKYPEDYAMQKYIYNEQYEAKMYMLTVSDLQIKQFAIMKYPDDYSMQKYIYNEQYEAKAYMEKADDYELITIAIRKYPNDYSMQKYIYNEQYLAKLYMKSRTNIYAKEEAQRRYPNDYAMQKYIYDQLSSY